MAEKKETFYDTLVNKVKNNKFLSIVMFCALAVGGVLAFSENALSSLKAIQNWVSPPKAQLSIHIQPYDLITGITEPPIVLPSANISDKSMSTTAESLASQILDVIQPDASMRDVELEILEDHLISSEPVTFVVNVYPGGSMVGQVPPILTELGESVDLKKVSGMDGVISVDCNCIKINVSSKNGGLRDIYFEIYPYQETFSFEPDNQVSRKLITFEIKKIKIILEPVATGEVDPEVINTARYIFESQIREKLASEISSIEVLEVTREGLEKEREKILSSYGPGGVKIEVSERYEIDYIIFAKILILS